MLCLTALQTELLIAVEIKLSCYMTQSWNHFITNSCQLSACSAMETPFTQETITIKTLFLDSLLLSSGVVDRRGSFTLSSGAGEEVRWSILAGVLALLGRALGVDGLPREEGGLGEAAGLGEAVLPLGVAGDECRCLDIELGLEGKKIQYI